MKGLVFVLKLVSLVKHEDAAKKKIIIIVRLGYFLPCDIFFVLFGKQNTFEEY